MMDYLCEERDQMSEEKEKRKAKYLFNNPVYNIIYIHLAVCGVTCRCSCPVGYPLCVVLFYLKKPEVGLYYSTGTMLFI
jgi:hypothetical protein